MIKVNIDIDRHRSISVHVNSHKAKEQKFLDKEGLNLCNQFVKEHSKCISFLDWIYTFEDYARLKEKEDIPENIIRGCIKKLGNLTDLHTTRIYIKTMLNNVYEKKYNDFKEIIL